MSIKSDLKSSGSVVNAKVGDKNEKSIACDTFPADKISKILGVEVQRISGYAPDKTEPYLISSCIYVAKGNQKDRLGTSILVRDLKDPESAQKTLSAVSNSKQVKEVKGLGDSAYFNTGANQLTVRKGKRLITVTVTGSDKPENISSRIAKLAL